MIDKVINSYMIHDEFGNSFVVDGTKIRYSYDTNDNYLTVFMCGKRVAHFNNFKSFIKIATVIKSFTLQ